MDKKIGNLFMQLFNTNLKINYLGITRGFLLCLYTMVILGHDKQVHLSIYDMQKDKAKQVEIGVPFLLDITTHKFEDAIEPKEFTGFEHFSLLLYNAQKTFVNINGKHNNETIFTYIVTPEKKGSFTVGPITIKDKNGDIIESDQLNIVVADTAITQSEKRQQPYLLQTIIDSKSVYIGQKVKVIVRFCFKDEYENLSFMDSIMNNFHRGFISPSPEKGSIKINNEEYKYEQVTIELYPEKIGLLVIPMFQAAFIPAMRYRYGFGTQLQRAVQSNPKSIEVVSLPPSKEYKNVSAIGTFNQISFTLQQTQGNVGEGIVATMTVQGDGNLEIAKAPALHLPEGLHYYEGNNSIERLNSSQSRKKYEWIIQADNAGNYTIGAQTFSYFDLSSQSYKTLKTSPSYIKITDKNTTSPSMQKNPTNNTQPEPQHTFKEGEINYIHQKNLHQTATSPLTDQTLTWVIILLGMIAMIILTAWVFFYYFSTYLRNSFWINYLYYKYLFYLSFRRQDTQNLYQLFILIGNQYNLDLQGEQLSQCFLQLKLPDNTFQKWQHFIQLMLTINFSGKHTNNEEQKAFFTQAQYWFPVLLSCCKLQKRSYADKSAIS